MKKVLPYLMIAIAAILYWRMEPTATPHPAPSPEAPAVAEEVPIASAEPEVAPITPTKPLQLPKATPEQPIRAPEKEVKRERFDPKSTRKLDLPYPKSVRDLLEHRTPFALPRLPTGLKGNSTQTDTDTQGYFAGYAYYADGTTRRLRLQTKWGDIKFAIEDHEKDVKEWSRSGRTIRVENFARDSYAQVLQFPDGRMLYVKFQGDVAVNDYREPLRAQIGWLISDASDNPSTAPVALIDINAHNRMFPPGAPGAEEWPQRTSLKALTTTLPALPAQEEPAP